MTSYESPLSPWTLPLASERADLQTAGGKGASLSRLARAGFPVPDGFLVTAQAYRRFVMANNLAGVIAAALTHLEAGDAAALEQASQTIRSAFGAGKMPPEIRADLLAAYTKLQSPPLRFGDASQSSIINPLPVAVRSSATAEDLPELSFAGQQDTYLNVIGSEAVLGAVVNCWSSLWTGRAIGYRLRNRMAHADLALAVVVQVMVASRTAGVLFTANPLTGLLSETVIDAAFGLGEALVSGLVEPDHFVVDPFSGAIKSKTLGSKKMAAHPKAGGGVESLPEDAAARQTLGEEEIRRLAALGRKVQAEYGFPQDIEWAFAGEQLYLLQSRPVTSLFPVPQVSFDPLIVWFSFGAVQGIVGPLTPLGQESIRRVVVGAAKLFGVKLEYDRVDLFVTAGERIWARVSDLIRNPLGNRIFGGFLGFIEPSVGQILRQLSADPRLGAGRGRLRPRTLLRLAGFFLPVAVNVLRVVLQPEKSRARFDAVLESYLASVDIPAGADRFEQLANFAAFMQAQGGLAEALPFLLPRFLPVFAPAIAALNLIGRLVPGEQAGDHGFSMLALEVTRALPGNVTTEMDLALWRAATAIRADAASRQAFSAADAPGLARRYLDGALPAAAQAAVQSFLERYGMRGVGEIDLGQPRWREDPVPVMQALQSHLQIEPAFAPDVQFAKGEQVAREAIEELATRVRRQPGGWLKEKLVRAAARRVRLLMGARESPKFFAVRAMDRVRRALLQSGEEFAAAGTIERPDDLVFLQVTELQALSRSEARDWKGLVARRRLAYERELRRRQVPRVLVSDGRAFYAGVGAGTDTGEVLLGSPVSPGVVEGKVRVVLDPFQAQLSPGEILVCPGTDPAWTPLFMAAAGLVTEVGGMMTHGSVVAREYGIPAVVGVDQATLRLRTGQLIRLDGNSGYIVILERGESSRK
jgi:rifampicin phosphotransferase